MIACVQGEPYNYHWVSGPWETMNVIEHKLTTVMMCMVGFFCGSKVAHNFIKLLERMYYHSTWCIT